MNKLVWWELRFFSPWIVGYVGYKYLLPLFMEPMVEVENKQIIIGEKKTKDSLKEEDSVAK